MKKFLLLILIAGFILTLSCNKPVKPEAPAFSVVAGTYNEPQIVTLSSSDKDASIFYTTDGSKPDKNSILSDGKPITVSKTTKISAIAIKGNVISDISEVSYTIENSNGENSVKNDVNGKKNIEGKKYYVRWGDNLWNICKKYYGDPWFYPSLSEYNELKSPRHILSGSYILIPDKSSIKRWDFNK